MNGRFLFKNKIFWVTDERDYETFPDNKGYPTAITTNIGTYGQLFRNIYRWINGIRVEIGGVSPGEQEIAINGKRCNNCLLYNECTDGEDGSKKMVQECWGNKYCLWEPRYLCGDSHEPELNNCENLKGDGWCMSINTENCVSMMDMYKEKRVKVKGTQDIHKEVKKIKDIFN